MTVRHYVAQGGWLPYRGSGRPRALAGLEDWIAERFRRHAGNADVVRQELLAEKDIKLSLRTIEREVAPLRRQLEAEARATIRFETPPGKQLQIDFGERRVSIGGESLKVYLFVATLGYSRRVYVRAFANERQERPLRPSTSASIRICSTASATARRKSESPLFGSSSTSALLSSVIGSSVGCWWTSIRFSILLMANWGNDGGPDG